MLKSVHIYGSYRKNKTGVPFFLEHPVVIIEWNIGYTDKFDASEASHAQCSDDVDVF